jgi:hypothetical protein
VEHYHLERNHQGLENRLITPAKEKVNTAARIDAARAIGRAAELLLSGGVDIIRDPRLFDRAAGALRRQSSRGLQTNSACDF